MVRTLSARFRDSGIDSASLDAGVIVGHVAGLDRAALFAAPERPLNGTEVEAIERLARRRAAREPLAYILGEREFWSLSFSVDRSTLIPRPDSETLVEAALEWMPDRSCAYRILDLGTGSGCLLLALLAERPCATGVGVDRDPRACARALYNARSLGLAERAGFVAADWGAGLRGRFDLVVSNPPYVAAAEGFRLGPEIRRYEPSAALFAGEDGLDCFRAFAPGLAGLLDEGAVAVLEHAPDQAAGVAEILKKSGLRVSGGRVDLAARPRVLMASKARAAGV